MLSKWSQNMNTIIHFREVKLSNDKDIDDICHISLDWINASRSSQSSDLKNITCNSWSLTLLTLPSQSQTNRENFLNKHWPCNGLVVKALDSQSRGSRVQNHWVAARSTQPFILPQSIKWVPGISGNLVVKSKLLPRSGSSLEAVELHP